MVDPKVLIKRLQQAKTPEQKLSIYKALKEQKKRKEEQKQKEETVVYTKSAAVSHAYSEEEEARQEVKKLEKQSETVEPEKLYVVKEFPHSAVTGLRVTAPGGFIQERGFKPAISKAEEYYEHKCQYLTRL